MNVNLIQLSTLKDLMDMISTLPKDCQYLEIHELYLDNMTAESMESLRTMILNVKSSKIQLHIVE